MTKPELERLATEARNPRTARLDLLPTLELLQAMHHEDRAVADAVGGELGRIAAAVDAIAERMWRGGRLIYVGAGTSGRLCALDAAECGPTFGAARGQVLALLAGGEAALSRAVEGAEDDAAQGAADLRALGPSHDDAVVGVSASGRTPYVLGALQQARAASALTVAVACNRDSALAAAADLAIETATGPEVLAGSTRLKAGNATKQVLNMISTGVFVRLHKVYGNLMVDLQATNRKLSDRAVRIVMTACDLDRAGAEAALAGACGSVKTAIVAATRGVGAEAARGLLQRHRGSVRAALEAR